LLAKILGYYQINGKARLADVVIKQYGYQQIWLLLQPVLLNSGNTNVLLIREQKEKSTSVTKEENPTTNQTFDLLSEGKILEGEGE
jgi:hypothetical protein